MSNPFMMPPTGFGPGSQPLDHADEALEYLPLPQDMRTYAPQIPDVEALAGADIGPALTLLREIATACETNAQRGGAASFDVAGLDPTNRALIAETLGEGEVSAKVHGLPAIAVQESVFAGVWSLKGANLYRIEVASIPQCILASPFTPKTPKTFGRGQDTAQTAGVVNAPAVLVELIDKSARYTPETPLHVINMSLLPHTEEDLIWLDTALGQGAVTLLSRGYGNCRVTATALPYVWKVQFFNSMDTLILDTFEVTTIPEVVLAAAEDLKDSGTRILSVLEAIQ